MNNTASVFTGIVHGKTIELDRAPALPDGLQVNVTVQPLDFPQQPLAPFTSPGDGILASAGAWLDDAEEFDDYLAWTRQQRKLARPEPGE